ETLSDWIVENAKDNGDGISRLLQCGNNRHTGGGDKVRCRAYRLRRVGLDFAQISTAILMLYSNIAALLPSECFEALPERHHADQYFRIVLGVWMQEGDPMQALPLLRTRCRRQYRTAEGKYEFSPPDVDCHVTLPMGS